MFQVEQVNCICVDWKGGSRAEYTQAVHNIRVVGAEIAYFIQELSVKVWGRRGRDRQRTGRDGQKDRRMPQAVPSTHGLEQDWELPGSVLRPQVSLSVGCGEKGGHWGQFTEGL